MLINDHETIAQICPSQELDEYSTGCIVRFSDEWSRPIFNLTSDYRTLSKEERKQLDFEHLPKRRNYE